MDENKTNSTLEQLEKILKEYTSDSKYCFKMCKDDKLVVMEKLKDTLTTEKRKGVFDPKHAKFRANMLYVVKIIDVNSFEQCDSVENCYFDFSGDISLVIYKKGEIAKPDSYNTDINIVCSNGIHFFNTLESAFYYRGMPISWSGVWKEWRDNGELAICHFKK